jgi:hypothetical protein
MVSRERLREEMKMRFALMALGVAVALETITGCATRNVVLSTTQRAAIRARAEAHFARAFYLKPAETNSATAQARQLAPLLIVEAPGTNALPDLPATANRPQIFFQAGRTTLNEKQHEQMTYWWAYPKVSSRSRGALPAQGVRITLNFAGRPVIWEVLADTSGAKVIFVAQSLEVQAMREFAAPMEGRRFAVERSLTDAPNVVVACVIEDGAVTMGPIVYLCAKTRDVSTVICRCMPSQAKALAGQMDYALGGPQSARVRATAELERALRWPRDF